MYHTSQEMMMQNKDLHGILKYEGPHEFDFIGTLSWGIFFLCYMYFY